MAVVVQDVQRRAGHTAECCISCSIAQRRAAESGGATGAVFPSCIQKCDFNGTCLVLVKKIRLFICILIVICVQFGAWVSLLLQKDAKRFFHVLSILSLSGSDDLS